VTKCPKRENGEIDFC